MATTPDFGANLLDMFFRAAARGGDRPFLWAKREGTYRPWPWRRVAAEVRALAKALTASGFAPGDRAVIVAENRPEWLIADFAIMAAGGITVPVYTTNSPGDHAYILNHSGAKAVLCSGRRPVADRLLPALREAGDGLALIIAMDPIEGAEGLPVAPVPWADALALGEREGDGTAERAAAAAGPDDVACFIYTSGTGGRPKGVMLTHRSLLANVRGAYGLLQQLGIGDEVFLSFLPLSHAYEHTAGQFFPIAIGAQIYYAEGAETLSTNLLEARPTIMTCVPRLYEVLRQRITLAVDRQGGLRAKLFYKALELGRRRYEDPGSLGPLDRVLDRALERLVRDKVRARFGGRMKALVSGGAPLNYDVGVFFVALGLPVFQGYGQTEASPLISCNPPGGRIKLRTVGPPVAGVEVKIAPDGEILVRGDLVMKGYWRDEAETARVLRDGWLHTGDVGHLDEDGYLVITDRKKDIIINSGGDNIAPQRVEGVLTLQPEIAQALVYGDRRPNLVALIVPSVEAVKAYAREARVDPDPAALAEDPGFRRRLDQAVDRANGELSAIERVRRYHVVPEPFSVDNGLMTPTLKLKRQEIYRRYADVLEGLYGGAAGAR